MRIKAITAAAAILWGACMFLVGIVHLAAPAYGTDFLRAISSVYPGFHAARSFWDVLLGTLYGFVDGAVAGYVFGVLYRWIGDGQTRMARSEPQPASTTFTYRRAS